MFPHEYKRALAEAKTILDAQAAEAKLLAAAPVSSHGDAFEELKRLAAEATLAKPPAAIALPLPQSGDAATDLKRLHRCAGAGLDERQHETKMLARQQHA